MKVLDLFSGIGGFSVGLEAAGFETVGFCEIDPYCRKVLDKHWPGVPVMEDVRDVRGEDFRGVHVVCGGFPCQDLSLAGNRAGLEGERSGLWSHLFRIITEVRPRWAVIENVPGLRTLGADRVLAELGGAGYAAWPLVVGAVHAGAPHRRQRVWIVAYSDRVRLPGRAEETRREERVVATGYDRPESNFNAAYSEGERPGEAGGFRHIQPTERIAGGGQANDAPDTNRQGLEKRQSQQGDTRTQFPTSERGYDQWDWSRAPEPVLRGVDDGLPCGLHRTKRLKALGNSVVPQIVEQIGRAILRIEATI